MALSSRVKSKTTGSIVTTGEFTVDKVQNVVNEILNKGGTANDIKNIVVKNLPVQELNKILKSETALGDLFRTLKDGDPSIPLDIKGNRKSKIAQRFGELSAEAEDRDLKLVYARISENFDRLNTAERQFAAKVPTSRTALEKLLDTNTAALNRFLNSRQDIRAKTTAEVGFKQASFNINLSISRDSAQGVLLDKLTTNVDKATIEALAKKFVDDNILWEQIGTSPSILERIIFTVQNIIKELDVRDTPSSVDFVTKRKGKAAFNNAEKKLIQKAARARKKLKEVLVRYKAKIRDKALESDFNLVSLINAGLHDAIQANMHNSTEPADKRYLRYQTGRFASSAEALNIIRTKGSATVFYNYLRDPYEFAYGPSGSMFTLRGRDAEHLIDQSIKDIAIGRLNSRFRIKTEAI